MSKSKKTWLVVASLILISTIAFVAVMAELNWDFTKLSTTKYETNEYAITDDFQSISITTDTADITFHSSDDTTASVVCYEQKNITHSVSVKNGTLVIEVIDTRAWYEHIGIFFGNPKVTLYIPQRTYDTLRITSDTGDVTIPAEFQVDKIDISNHTGDVTSNASATSAVKIKTTTGDIHVENLSADELSLTVSTGKITVTNVTSNGDFATHVSTGKTNLTNIQCKNLISSGNTGDIHLKEVIAADAFSIERSTGDVTFDSCDASSISVITDTGDVTGSLKTEKVFLTETDTGRIDVPKSTTGGSCEIETDTGDIVIRIG